jgi:hypothetical protein
VISAFPASAADAPLYTDADGGRAGARRPAPPEVVVRTDRICCVTASPGYHRPVTGGPGYVGSVRGLGRPSYDGLWPPPGYGSYREFPPD